MGGLSLIQDFRSNDFIKTANKMKIRSKQNTYHVTNENIAPSEVTIMLETKGGMPSKASPSLVDWLLLEYYLGCLGNPQA